MKDTIKGAREALLKKGVSTNSREDVYTLYHKNVLLQSQINEISNKIRRLYLEKTELGKEFASNNKQSMKIVIEKEGVKFVEEIEIKKEER